MAILPLLLLLLFALAGCVDAPPPTDVTSFDTLSSGTVRAVSGEVGAWDAGLSEPWEVELVTRIGSATAQEEAFLFSAIRSLAVDALERVYVLESQSNQVRVFDLRGNHVRSMGRSGQGPGELMRPRDMAFSSHGTLWVSDPGNGRFQLFDTAGVDLGSVPMGLGRSVSAWGWGFDGSGYLRELSRSQDGFHLVRSDPASGLPMDSLPLPPDETDRFVLTQTENGRITGVGIYGIPFAPERQWGFQGDRLWTANGESYEMAALSLSGGLDTTIVVHRELPREPIPPDELDAYWSTVNLTPADVRKLDLSKLPEVKRSFERFFVDGEGFLWVSRWAPGVFSSRQSAPRPYDVFSPEGRFLGTLTLDMKPSPTPWAQGDLLVGVTADELDVPMLMVWRVRGRSGSSHNES